MKYKGWLIIKNENGNYDAFTPDDSEQGKRYCVEECQPEIEDLPTIEEIKTAIKNY